MRRLILTIWLVFLGSSLLGAERYEPVVGDIVFQSLYPSALVNTIEGVTKSPYSHCGVVVGNQDRWLVLEAIGPVKETPLNDWWRQARDRKIYVYRLRQTYSSKIPEFIEAARTYLGRPYDLRYRLDDERIYCSELIHKAFKDASGLSLGKLELLGNLNWRPYEGAIEDLEGGFVPHDRLMITPRSLSEAAQLTYVGEFEQPLPLATAMAVGCVFVLGLGVLLVIAKQRTSREVRR